MTDPATQPGAPAPDVAAQPNPTPDPTTESGEGAEPFYVAKTQDDFNKKAGLERESIRDAALKNYAEEKGFDSVDDFIAAAEAQHSAEAAVEPQEIADLKRQHKETLKTVQTDLDAHKEALQGYLDKEREGLQEHVTELLDTMSAPDQLAYITKHGDALKGEQAPKTVGRGSSPGGGSQSAAAADVTPGLGRLRVAYSQR